MGAYLSGGEADFRVAEDVALWRGSGEGVSGGMFGGTYREEIDYTHHDDNDTCAKDESPCPQADVFRACCGLVEVG